MPESPVFRSGLRRLLYPAVVRSVGRDEESNDQLDESRQRLGLRPEDSQVLPAARRTLAGRFVDIATGEVLIEQVDVDIPGVVPFRWARFWRSNQPIAGSMGNGWRHSYDITLLEDRHSRQVIIRLPDNRGILFPALAEGESFLDRSEKRRLCRDQYGYQLQGTDGLIYYFATNPSGCLCRLASVGTIGTTYRLRFSYTSTGQLRRISDDFQRVIDVVTNAHQSISRLEIVYPNQPQKRQTLVEYQYDELHDLRDVVGHNQPMAQYHYRQHRLIRLTDSRRQSVYFAYEKIGSQHVCNELTLERGQSLQFRYLVEEGRTHVTDRAGGVRQYIHEEGIVQRSISAGGRQRVWFFSAYGELLSEQNALGNTSFFTYDEQGNMTQAAWPDGGTLQMQYNDLGQLITLTDRAGGLWQWTYDEVGRLLTCADPQGAETMFTYAEDGLLRERVTPAGRSVWGYDAYANRNLHTDETGRQTTWEYDFLGQLISVIQPDGARAEPVGKIDERATVADKKGESTAVQDHLTYDADGFLIRLRRSNRLNWQFIRDAAGRVREYTRPDGTSTNFHYNAAGRLTEVLFSDGSWYHYDYRPDGWLMEAATPTTITQFTRDPSGRIVAETSGSVQITTDYDNVGRLTSWQSSEQAGAQNSYNDQGYLVRQAYADWQLRVTHDRLGRRVGCQMPGGLESRWQYNTGSLPVNHKLFWGSGLQASRSQAYTWEHRRLVRIEDNQYGTAAIRYDQFNDPTEVICSAGWTDRWVAERAHYQQRLLKPATETAGLGWQMLTVGTAHFYYDADGYLREKRVSGQIWTFDWHESGVLQRVVRPDNRVVTFAYDALGRRIDKKIDEYQVRWAWSGRQLLHEWHQPPGGESVQLTWYMAGGEEPTMLQVGSQWYSVVCNVAGQPLSFHNLQGDPVWAWRWCLFGKKHTLTGPPHWHTYLGRGQFDDPEAGLIYANFRYYDAATGLPVSPEYSSPAGWVRAEWVPPHEPESYLSAARYIRVY